MIYLLVGYMWLFIHRPFEVWPWLAELRVERVYMLITLAYWVTQPKQWTANRLNLGIALLGASIMLSTFSSSWATFETNQVQNWFKLALFYVLVMTSVRSLGDLKILVAAFVVILALYELHSLREYFNGRGAYRMATWRMIGVDESMGDPNSFAASVIYGIPLLLPAAVLACKRWQKRAVGGLVILAVTCVSLTGSRSGFVGLLLTFAGLGMASKYRWRLLVLMILASVALWSGLSENLRNRYLTLIDPSYGPANAQGSAESRKVFFFKALDIWQGHPIFGVGPGGFAYESGTGMQSHSLYAETLSELGAVGAIAVSVLVAGFFANLRIARRIYLDSIPNSDIRFCYFVVCATSFTVLQLLFLGFAGHNVFRYTWLWYAAFSALALRFLREQSMLTADVSFDNSTEDSLEPHSVASNHYRTV